MFRTSGESLENGALVVALALLAWFCGGGLDTPSGDILGSNSVAPAGGEPIRSNVWGVAPVPAFFDFRVRLVLVGVASLLGDRGRFRPPRRLSGLTGGPTGSSVTRDLGTGSALL
jgi:hypothetical protein